MEYNKHILIHRFLESARKFPDRPALQFSHREYTYLELMNAAYALASKILSANETSPVVGLMAHKTFDTYVGILGILMAGKGYLPLNPNFPPERNNYILETSGTSTILTGGGSLERIHEIISLSARKYLLIESVSESDEEMDHFDLPSVEPDDMAYLLFTSGSTGKPKGVPVSNNNVTAYLDNITSLFEFFPEDRFTQTFDLTFDLSIHDLFVCWSVGACLCIPEDNSSFGLKPYMAQMKPTVWFSVPSAAQLMDRMRLLGEGVFSSLRMSFFCGEALLKETAIKWEKAAPSSRMVNLYGPTEATIAISAYILPEEMKSQNGVVSIGQIFPGHQYFIKDEEQGRGLLCLGGPQVVKGYYKDRKLTDEYFLKAGSPSLFYNTGDLVEADSDGDLFFLGRADSEVKISGYRVNLLEIDHVLNSIERVRQGATLYLEDPGGVKMLVSFLVMTEEMEDDIPFVLMHCRRQLPHYMVPEKVIFVDALPLNPNGKTDRRALADIFRKNHE